MDLIGDVGGVQTILVVFGSYITGLVAERLLHAEMMKQIYHTSIKEKKGRKGKKQPPSSRYRKAKIEDITNEETIAEIENTGKIEVSRRKIMNSIINRIVFNYTGWDISKEFIKCIWCRKMKSPKAR